MNIDDIKEERKVPAFITGLLAIILIITYIFTLKSYEPAKNIIITGGIVVYPISFLVTALLGKYYGFKETRKAIYISSLLYVSFMFLVILSIMPSANELTEGYNAIVQYLFANNFKELSNVTIFYPMLGQFLGVLIAYFASHLLFATIYSVTKNYTVDYFAMGLGLFISYIIDRILFIPLLLSHGLIKGTNTFNFLIQMLTSEFIAAVFMTLALIIIYIIITNIKKSKN